MPDSGIDRQVKDLLDAFHLFATAFQVYSVHSLCNSLSLFWCHRRKSLCSEQIDTCALGSQIRLQSDKDDWCGWAEVENFRIPLIVMFSDGPLSKFEGIIPYP